MSAKIWVLLALVNAARSRDIVVGSNDIGRKVYDQSKHAGPAIWRQVENITITTNDTEVISKIVITDLRPEKDGDVRIVEGGEGRRNVTIELKSPTVLRGYEFHIEAYAVNEDELKTIGQNSESAKNKPEEQTSAVTPNAGSTSSFRLDKHLASTTEAPPTDEGSINRRQNRDTENKDKSSQENSNITSSLTNTASTTEKPKQPLAMEPTSTTQKLGQIFPVVNRGSQQGLAFDHPGINIYELNHAPESTAFPSTNVTPEENINTQAPPTGRENSKHTETNVDDSNKLHTHISYPQFGTDGFKQSPEPVISTASPVVEDKIKNLRHRRDVANPIEEKKGIQNPFNINIKTDTETNPLNSQVQKHKPEYGVKPGTVVSSNPSSLENQDAANEKSQPNIHTMLRGSHLFRGFKKTTTTNASSIPSSTENNKISTPLPAGGESTQTTSKLTHSQQSVIGDESSSSTTMSDTTEPTAKSESTLENITYPALQPKKSDAAEVAKSDFNVRRTRDTASTNNKVNVVNEVPPVLWSSSSTLKPNTYSQSESETNATSTDSPPLLQNTKLPEVKSTTAGASMGTASDSPQIDEKDRNTRDAMDTNKKTEKDILPNNKKNTLGTTTAIKPVSTSEREANESGKNPIQSSFKHHNESSPKAPITESKIGEEKERQTRDTSAVDESEDNKKEASTDKAEATEPKTLLAHETKLTNENSTNLEDKSTPSSTLNYKNAQPRHQIPVWNKEDQEESSKLSDNGPDKAKEGQLSPKIPRKAKGNEESKKSNDGGHVSDIALATGLTMTSAKPMAKDDKEKHLKMPNNEDSSKSTEKPE